MTHRILLNRYLFVTHPVLVEDTGFEPVTFCLQGRCSTKNELIPHIECGCAGRTQGNNMFRNTKYSNWWGIRDSNPYAFRHMILSHARLPIPPIPHIAPAYIYEKRYAKTSCDFHFFLDSERKSQKSN